MMNKYHKPLISWIETRVVGSIFVICCGSGEAASSDLSIERESTERMVDAGDELGYVVANMCSRITILLIDYKSPN